jgi:hypothetical protein
MKQIPALKNIKSPSGVNREKNWRNLSRIGQSAPVKQTNKGFSQIEISLSYSTIEHQERRIISTPVHKRANEKTSTQNVAAVQKQKSPGGSPGLFVTVSERQ